MNSHEIRNTFLKYFNSKDHFTLPSSSLLPENDPSILFTNAGMNQFKNIFTGLESPKNLRATTIQKCLRAGGKHNDLENVGHTARHHTFFEMCGNFSFGDYFKKEAIIYAWELLTKNMGLPKEKLYVTVYNTDEEAYNFWKNEIGLSSDRIFRFGEKDNFWRMGNTGPCGPCSEIFYNHGDKTSNVTKKDLEEGEDTFIEIWNLVFMQYFENEQGEKTKLPKPSVDTGAGIERLAAVLQNKKNNYDTDIFNPIKKIITDVSKIKYVEQAYLSSLSKEDQNKQASIKVVMDHARATAFLLSDGVLPSNEGAGYVLRRIMRRAIRYAKNLSSEASLFEQATLSVVDSMNKFYPELQERKPIIQKNTHDETKRFLKTLDQGMDILNKEIKNLSAGDKLSGKTVFKLYDTFGFPMDLTQVIAQEKNININQSEFDSLMNEAKAQSKSRSGSKTLNKNQQHFVEFGEQAVSSLGQTSFVGYEKTEVNTHALYLSDGQKITDKFSEGQQGLLITNRTPFYAESGGQIGDIGHAWNESKTCKIEILDCQKHKDIFIHSFLVNKGNLQKNDAIVLKINTEHRKKVQKNHSATHLLHAALRDVLGESVSQAGSLVNSEKLRFDFHYDNPVKINDLKKIEDMINSEISKNVSINLSEKPYDQAIEDGALALFGEKYTKNVRTVKMGNFSHELCGGTHVQSTSEIQLIKIVNETGVSSGVRRIEAITGEVAINFLNHSYNQLEQANNYINFNESWSDLLARDPNSSPVVKWMELQKEKIKQLEKNLSKLEKGSIDIESIINSSRTIKYKEQTFKLCTSNVALSDRKILSEMADQIKDKLLNTEPKQSIVILVGEKVNNAHPVIVSLDKKTSEHIKSGEIVKMLGAKGGGRPDFAQGSLGEFSQDKLTNLFN